MHRVDLRHIAAITFDCYGTLIDWETGILSALRPLIGPGPSDAELLAEHARHERVLEAGPYRPYRWILREVARRVGQRFGAQLRDEQLDAFAHSVGDWPAFPETPAALARLQRHAKVVIISNVDRDLFARTQPKLGVTPDLIVTAEDCRSYKPALHNFHVAIERLALPVRRILHAAESRYHDIEPANTLGLPSVWVNRPGHAGPSASGVGLGRPDRTVHSLTELADLLDAAHPQAVSATL